jgi:hypothetical protein
VFAGLLHVEANKRMPAQTQTLFIKATVFETELDVMMRPDETKTVLLEDVSRP